MPIAPKIACVCPKASLWQEPGPKSLSGERSLFDVRAGVAPSIIPSMRGLAETMPVDPARVCRLISQRQCLGDAAAHLSRYGGPAASGADAFCGFAGHGRRPLAHGEPIRPYPHLFKLYADGGYEGPAFLATVHKILRPLGVEIVKRSDPA